MSEPRAPEVGDWLKGALPSVEQIRARLLRIFPEGVDYRGPATAERAAKSAFVFLYAFAIEGVSERRVRPAMVTSMSDAQAAELAPEVRVAWWQKMSTARTVRIPIAGRWYAENTREPIRDETFRAWKEYGALLETQVPTTSSVPRYQLAADFAALLNPALSDDEFEAALSIWHRNHLTPAARARLALAHEQAVRGGGTLVTFPDGTTRTLAIGPSTPLVQAVVERFAPRFLRQPVVLAVTESRQRLAYEDSAQLRRIGLSIDERLMPDVILADLQGGGGELRLVFIECVATGGAMTAERVNAIRAWLTRSNLAELRLAFGTVFGDRTEAVVRRYLSEVAWGSFAWFASEPERIVAFLTEDLSLSQASLDLVTLRAQASDEPA